MTGRAGRGLPRPEVEGMDGLHRLTLTAALVVLLTPPPAVAQSPDGASTDSITVTPGSEYEASSLYRFLFGSDYRDLWTTPVRVELLDLDEFAGGLTPIRRGGGMQTRSLRFEAADGRQFAVRSVDKDPSAILPEELRETLVDDIVQDQISSGHPFGALVVGPILDAVGVLHAEPRLVVVPDDARLGEFREDFANMLGIIEERPDENESELASFAGASLVIGTPRLLERLEEDLEVFDSREFLAARLTDLFLGDWDRHADQWRWARFGEERTDSWKPIPRDRDQALVRMDGALLALTRQYYPQFVDFGADYPGMVGLTWNGRDLDRRLLSDLAWPTWDSVATELESRITDDVIDAAVGRLPSEIRPFDGERLGRDLRARRDGLQRAARRFYEQLASEVEVHATDADEIADVRRLSASELDVVVTATDPRYGTVEVFRRRFDASETKEIRLFMRGGADSVRVHGNGALSIGIRVEGGGSADTFVDESGGTHFYDEGNGSVFVRGPGTTVDQRDFEEPPVTPSPLNRDWGTHYRFPITAGFSPDIGVFGGISIERYDFGFRMIPWASSAKLQAAWGATAATYRLNGELRFNRENSGTHFLVSAHASGLDILHFHGLGNETKAERGSGAYRIEQQQFGLDPRLVLPLSESARLSLGPTVQFAVTDRAPRWLDDQPLPYGMADFGQAGWAGQLHVDGRNRERSATHGAALTLGGVAYPALWDVDEAFGEVHATASAYLSPGQPLRPTLALRAGAKKLFGTYPFHEAAYLGDAGTVRLGREQRFGGDALVHANAELRLSLFRAVIVLPAAVGVLGLYDIGRVWLEDEDSNRWHDAYGGGLWLAFLRPENAFTFTVAQSDERTGIYVGAGFAF